MSEQNSSTPTPPPAPVMTDDEVLRYTQKARREVADNIMGDIKKVSDPRQVQILLVTLKDMDAQAISKKRLVVDAGASDALKLAGDVMAQVLKKVPGIDALNTLNTRDDRRAAPVVPEDAHTPEIIEGEMQQGIIHDTYKDFVARVK